jgi:hypothetical protein
MTLGWMVKGFNPKRSKYFFFATTVFKLALGSTQPPVQWILEAHPWR